MIFLMLMVTLPGFIALKGLKMDNQTDQKRPKKGSKTLSEALSWVGECSEMVSRGESLKHWPFPTYKGQPLEPVIYPKQPRIDDSWEEALL